MQSLTNPGVYYLAGAVTNKPSSNGGLYIINKASNTLIVGIFIDAVTGGVWSVSSYGGTWKYTNITANLFSATGVAGTSNSDFNNYTTAGVYMFSSDALVQSCSNRPTGEAGRLVVWLFSETFPGAWSSLMQEYTSRTGVRYARRIVCDGSGVPQYNAWTKTSMTSV